MSTIMPQGGSVKRAVKWISENLKEDPTKNLKRLINEAIANFDLSPVESEMLINFYRDSQKDQ